MIEIREFFQLVVSDWTTTLANGAVGTTALGLLGWLGRRLFTPRPLSPLCQRLLLALDKPTGRDLPGQLLVIQGGSVALPVPKGRSAPVILLSDSKGSLKCDAREHLTRREFRLVCAKAAETLERLAAEEKAARLEAAINGLQGM